MESFFVAVCFKNSVISPSGHTFDLPNGHLSKQSNFLYLDECEDQFYQVIATCLPVNDKLYSQWAVINAQPLEVVSPVEAGRAIHGCTAGGNSTEVTTESTIITTEGNTRTCSP